MSIILIPMKDVYEEDGRMFDMLRAFQKRVGTFFVSSGVLHQNRSRLDIDCLEFEAYFDSRAWTGLP